MCSSHCEYTFMYNFRLFHDVVQVRQLVRREDFSKSKTTDMFTIVCTCVLSNTYFVLIDKMST